MSLISAANLIKVVGLGRLFLCGDVDGIRDQDLAELGVSFARVAHPKELLGLPLRELGATVAVNVAILAPDVDAILREADASCYLFVANAADANDRVYWEREFIKAGFRKHPQHFTVTHYGSMNTEAGTILLLMELVPQDALDRYPLEALAQERDLHMDMTRAAGSRSDAHLVRYASAAMHVRPGDTVIDAACGLGYGSRVIWQNSQAKSVLGIDDSEYAIEYATMSFADANVSFKRGRLPDALLTIADNSVDFIASFETVEHLQDPDEFLRQCTRVLRPSGRLMISVPNDWADENGIDPNPYHFHVFDWPSICHLTAKHLRIEKLFAQDADRKKVAGKWEATTRAITEVSHNGGVPEGVASEWCLVLAAKYPRVGDDIPYVDTMFRTAELADLPQGVPEVLAFGSQYDNPWLARSLITVGLRTTDKAVLAAHAAEVDSSSTSLPDKAAALAVLAYAALENTEAAAEDRLKLAERAGELAGALANVTSPISIRWQVSLTYVQALLCASLGKSSEAASAYEHCVSLPFGAYSPVLATKVVDAAFRLGLIRFANGDKAAARSAWERGAAAAVDAVSSRWHASLPWSHMPDFFPREITQVMDLGTRCFSALSWFNELSERPATALRLFYNRQLQLSEGLRALQPPVQPIHEQAREPVADELQQLREALVNEPEDIPQPTIEGPKSTQEALRRLLLCARFREQDEFRVVDATDGTPPSYRWLLGVLRRKIQRRLFSVKLFRSERAPVTAMTTMTIMTRSGLFDPDYYLTANPDVVAAGIDPVEHYTLHGGREGRAASAIFDSQRYLSDNPDVAGSGINPLMHFIEFGAIEGREVYAPQAKFDADALIAELSGFEATALTEISQLKERMPIVLSMPSHQGVFGSWAKFLRSLPNGVIRVIFVPWLVKGGADLAALNCLRAAMQEDPDGVTLLVATDHAQADAMDWVPEGAHVRFFSDFGPLTREERVTFVRALIFAVQPKAVLNVNSLACWEAFQLYGRSLKNYTSLHAMMFCRDYLPDGTAAGYADTHLRDCVAALDVVYFDNERFRAEMMAQLYVSADSEARFELLPQPTGLIEIYKLLESPAKRPRVLWAGRFARQKNIELLIEIVAAMPDFDFDIYGGGESALAKKLADAALRHSNLHLKGSYTSFEALDVTAYSALLFTSRWEGLPTTIIAAAALGIPIVTSDVGGIRELVDNETGWLISALDDPLPYKLALREAASDLAKTKRKTAAARARVSRRHSWDNFLSVLRKPSAFLGS
ncbi:methyltransferase domain-containing protein [Rhodoplanes serenus]|uniref:Methyltransferase domain-containing protein n=1 Tax=Rhodoplanes serenus TaxID=200615 RepID=A0A9X4XMB4_9BRAD|nr:methyltransferase domain-containing protein [Rhodoplanes serenus]MTW17287.1 methyltransferase domain-containing protein [Rhodoplanes serenus]